MHKTGNMNELQKLLSSAGYPCMAQSYLFTRDDWHWDTDTKSINANLSESREIVYFYDNPFVSSQGSAGVRGTTGFQYGIHYFEITINEPISGASVMIGVGEGDTCLHYENFKSLNLIGKTEKSYGLCHKGTLWHNSISKKYCEPFFDKQTKIGVLLDLNRSTLAYFKNGIYLGIAFKDMNEPGRNRMRKTLFPIISSTSDIELELGRRFSILANLQDICLEKIKALYHHNYDDLPLPTNLINYLNVTS